jgi:hypothetical protein
MRREVSALLYVRLLHLLCGVLSDLILAGTNSVAILVNEAFEGYVPLLLVDIGQVMLVRVDVFDEVVQLGGGPDPF